MNSNSIDEKQLIESFKNLFDACELILCEIKSIYGDIISLEKDLHSRPVKEIADRLERICGYCFGVDNSLDAAHEAIHRARALMRIQKSLEAGKNIREWSKLLGGSEGANKDNN